MDVFSLRNALISDYANYIGSFIRIADAGISRVVQDEINAGLLWPEPLVQLNPSFEVGAWIDDLVAEGDLHSECARVFRVGKSLENPVGNSLRLYRHQTEAIGSARSGQSYVLTTGTGSGKSLAYIVPIVDHVLREGSGNGVRAIVVYPMNALANSQFNELEKFLGFGFHAGKSPVTFARYTGQESEAERSKILGNPPDILLTNYVMLELILTRPEERRRLIERSAQTAHFVVLDEIHTYRGRQGADVALLMRRLNEALRHGSTVASRHLQFVGTSATLAAGGGYASQQRQIADVASLLFGQDVSPSNVIGETLRRSTPEVPAAAFDKFRSDLIKAVTNVDAGDELPSAPEDFVKNPVSIWIEDTFGIEREVETNRWVRRKPQAIRKEDVTSKSSAAWLLAQLTGKPVNICERVIQKVLLAGYQSRYRETNAPVFAFRLHQFINRGDSVYASLETLPERFVTVQGQKYVPGTRKKVLHPLTFCRECGQEYYTVYRSGAAKKLGIPGELRSRLMNEPLDAGDGEAGYLYITRDGGWPSSLDEQLDRLPEDWIETDDTGDRRVRHDYRELLPQPVRVSPDGTLLPAHATDGHLAYFLPMPFRFCLSCTVAYSATVRDDFAKLGSLSTGGRSTATTLLSLLAVRRLRSQTELKPEARKLLSFTDNRQDASLQAGHFNDFVDVTQLRAALFRAVRGAGSSGIRHDELPQRIFDALALPKAQFMQNPDAKFLAEKSAQEALRNVLAYRLYLDLRRGWRVTAPNLEQCGLLTIVWGSHNSCRTERTGQSEDRSCGFTAPPHTRGLGRSDAL